MDDELLTPETVTATYQEGVLTIEASGQEDGFTDIRIVADAIEPMERPLFRVEGEQTPAIGMFPYEVRASFPMDEDPHEIALRTADGTELIPVRSLTSR